MADARTHADGVPDWMAQAGIRKGEWLIMTKAQLRTQQRPDKPLKVQVWATGILHTAGYQGQQAYTMRNGKKVPLAPNDIIKELYAVARKYFQDAHIEATEEQLLTLRESKETIRRALSELEADGVCQRTDDRGRPVGELTHTEQKGLANGKIRLSFWLKPRNADKKSVEWEWHQRTAISSTDAVDKNRLQAPPIWKILNVFQIQKPSKSQLSNTQFQEKITHAYEDARQLFIERISVDTLSPLSVDIVCPLQAVDAPGPLAVDTTGGTLESNAERNDKSSSSEIVAEQPEVMMMTFERFHFDLCQQFTAAGKPTPGPKLARPVYHALKTDHAAFLQFLTPARLQPIRSAGILPDLLQNFKDVRKATERRQEAQHAEANQLRRAEDLRSAHLIMEQPGEHVAEDVEWAKEILKNKTAAA